MMINNMNEFIKEHPHAVIVNYDIDDKFECGKTYRTSTNKTEEFRKDKKGKYLEYPYIQPYLSLSDLSSYELFIIRNKKIYQLELWNSNSYKIKKEITNINFDIWYDDVFYAKGKNPTIVNEDIWIIEE